MLDRSVFMLLTFVLVWQCAPINQTSNQFLPGENQFGAGYSSVQSMQTCWRLSKMIFNLRLCIADCSKRPQLQKGDRRSKSKGCSGFIVAHKGSRFSSSLMFCYIVSCGQSMKVFYNALFMIFRRGFKHIRSPGGLKVPGVMRPKVPIFLFFIHLKVASILCHTYTLCSSGMYVSIK